MIRRLVLCMFLGFTALALAASPMLAQEAARPPLRPRKLAPGVLTVIPPEPQVAEIFSGPREFQEVTKGVAPDVLEWTPQYSPRTDTLAHRSGYKRAKDAENGVIFRHGVWDLEFAFKPLRMIYVDIPQPSGQFQRKPVWYMVYRVRNLGYHLNPEEGHFKLEGVGPSRKVQWTTEADPADDPDDNWFGYREFGVNHVNHTVRFFPRFVLKAHDVDKSYLDQLIPVAVPLIQKREDPAIKLHDSVSITTVDIEVSEDRIDHSVWGVVTWMDLDPRIDFFSIYVRGLTNAYKFQYDDKPFKLGDVTGRKISPKTLQLCFWRPGDEVTPDEKEIHYGMPFFASNQKMKQMLALYGVDERIDYRWFYP